CPAHPMAQALLRALRQSAQGRMVWGLAAPSANRFGRVSPTTAQHVHSEFHGGQGHDEAASLLILDGGPCEVGIESTIVDCTRGEPVLLRPGAISVQALSEACGHAVRGQGEITSGPDAPRASGTLAAHYAPNAKVRLMQINDLQQALQPDSAQRRGVAGRIGVYMRTRPAISQEQASQPPAGQANGTAQLLLRAMPAQAMRAAQHLFATLRALDDAGVKEIWVEATPATLEWAGVADRLQRASAA
ncbi:MAG: translation factor Sua5, partial [Betaproteobacteria bacterium]|nr:translation factor Sua5 [Betaproteobacteria bacterium]